eukprot:scaffold3114_cov114-Isochrysis_galbana.AAC.1
MDRQPYDLIERGRLWLPTVKGPIEDHAARHSPGSSPVPAHTEDAIPEPDADVHAELGEPMDMDLEPDTDAPLPSTSTPVAQPWRAERLTRAGRGTRPRQFQPTMLARSSLAAPGGDFIIYLCSGPTRPGDITQQQCFIA